MAHDLVYINSQSESLVYTFDFTDDLPGDSSLVDIGVGASTITAYSSAGTDVSSTILASKTLSGMTLYVTISAVTDCEEYRIEFVAMGTTTSRKVTKVLEVRGRRYIQGSY